MVATFKGFPRALERSAIRPGRWFVAARGARAVLCFATDLKIGRITAATLAGMDAALNGEAQP